MLQLPLQDKQNSAKFTEETDNPAKETTTDGGYTYTRPQYTRRPRKTWVIGFTNLTEEERVILSNFFDQVKGGSNAFEWTHPVTKQIHNVRFKGTIQFIYRGAGTTYRWDTSNITLREV